MFLACLLLFLEFRRCAVQCQQLANGDPSNPDYVNKAWFFMYCYKVIAAGCLS
jgi:hypothetical protein